MQNTAECKCNIKKKPYLVDVTQRSLIDKTKNQLIKKKKKKRVLRDFRQLRSLYLKGQFRLP